MAYDASSRSGPDADDPATTIFAKLGDEYRDLWEGYVKDDRMILRSILEDPQYHDNDTLHTRLRLLEARYEARMIQLAHITSEASESTPSRMKFNGLQWGRELIVFLSYVSIGVSICVYTYKSHFT
jgi:hypothetical protein